MPDSSSQPPSRHPGSTPESLHPAQFEQLYKKHYQTLRIVALAAADRNDADDIVQEAAIIGLRQLERFEPGTNFTAWMATIVRGVAANTRRGNQRRKIRRLRHAREKNPNQSEHSVESALGSERLEAALATLDPDQRTCLLLKIVLAHTYKEIEAITGIPESTARSHVFRARRALLTRLPDLQHGGDTP